MKQKTKSKCTENPNVLIFTEMLTIWNEEEDEK